jgi:hypothetical protein
MSVLFTVFSVFLFFILSPGILVTLPKKGKKDVVVLVHAIIFGIVLYVSSVALSGLEGLTNPPQQQYIYYYNKLISLITRVQQKPTPQQMELIVKDKITLDNEVESLAKNPVIMRTVSPTQIKNYQTRHAELNSLIMNYSNNMKIPTNVPRGTNAPWTTAPRVTNAPWTTAPRGTNAPWTTAPRVTNAPWTTAPRVTSMFPTTRGTSMFPTTRGTSMFTTPQVTSNTIVIEMYNKYMSKLKNLSDRLKSKPNQQQLEQIEAERNELRALVASQQGIVSQITQKQYQDAQTLEKMIDIEIQRQRAQSRPGMNFF